jgi:phosphate transport system permease protein
VSNPSLQLTHNPIGYLTYAIWAFYDEPSQTSVDLSYDAALILFVIVLLLIVIGRVVVAVSRRHAE